MGVALHKAVDLNAEAKARLRLVAVIHGEWRPGFDRPWRRFGFTIPASIAASAMLLGVFAVILRPRPVALEHREAIEARIIDIPPIVAAPAADNQPRPAAQPIQPAPHTKPRPRMRQRIAPPAMAPPVASSGTSGIAVPSSVLHPEPPADTANVGQGSGGEIGGDTTGARAIYAPTPVIPDDLRENTMNTVAIARFRVNADGSVEVTLEKPTANPRLNQVLLAALKQWKFFPAIKDGAAVDSVFEINIPVTIQ
ncbi:MAG TPA: TonB family protein [Candidatus Binataceae bacterium]|nr:TonB family protein [Candidatus Binataceae bacterium]